MLFGVGAVLASGLALATGRPYLETWFNASFSAMDRYALLIVGVGILAVVFGCHGSSADGDGFGFGDGGGDGGGD